MRSWAILIPVYKDIQGLQDTLLSIRQDSEAVEQSTVIIVDDGNAVPLGSDDATRAATSGLDCIHLRMEKNSGIVAALNLGLERILLSAAEYVVRIDAGDYWVPGRLNAHRRIFDSDPNCVIAGGAAQFELLNGDFLFVYRNPETDDNIRRLAPRRSPFVHPSVALSVSGIRYSGLYSEHYPAAEDYDLFRRLLQNGNGGNSQSILVIKRLNARGISLSKRGTQIRSTLSVQLNYFQFLSIYSYIGIAASLVRYFLPTGLLLKYKKRIRSFSEDV